MPQAKKAKKPYLILSLRHEGEDAAIDSRNLGCPHYDDCLHEANAELLQASKAYRAKCKAGKTKGAERFADGTHTWVCSTDCPHRHTRGDYHLRLRKYVSDD